MTNNHILELIMKAVKLDKIDVLKAYKLADKKITPEDVDDVLKESSDPEHVILSDEGLELFLNGLILFKRGPSPDKKKKEPKKTHLTNNIILKKLKIALDLKDDDIIAIFTADDTKMIKSQLTAYFRREGHENYRACSDALLKSFIYGYGKYTASNIK